MNDLRRTIIETAFNAGEGHIASALSILDIVWVLYDRVLQPEDCFILSKGHGCLALYAVLAKKNIIDKSLLTNAFKFDSLLGGHPDRNKVPVEASTGSLGHGLPIAVGRALARKIRKQPGRVYCLVGDGECNEGSIWEACLIAAHHSLDNLTVIVDNNHSTDRAVNLENICGKFSSFGLRVDRENGHDHEKLGWALTLRSLRMPTAVIAHTIKGRGCKRMENDPSWHHRVPTETEMKEILQELK